jgi:tetratricopeptide (TPR) repeat protein
MNAQSDKRISADSNQVLGPAYDVLKNGNTVRAKALVEDVLADELDNPEVMFALRCVNFLAGRLDDPEGVTPEERGDFLLHLWKRFVLFTAGNAAEFERCINAFHTGVFMRALDEFLEALGGTHKSPRESELHRKAGICHKKLGEYETALSFLSRANTLRPDMPSVLAELADCYALCGNERAAKVLFRNAFFLDARQIDVRFLDSTMILRLIREVEKKGYAGDELLEWIPVYGALYGVFNIKHELRHTEAARLKQTIFALETELRETRDPLIVPRLVNHYFWLIDHFASSPGGDKNGIEETLLKIKVLDVNIYKQYAGAQNPAQN